MNSSRWMPLLYLSLRRPQPRNGLLKLWALSKRLVPTSLRNNWTT